MGGDNTTEETDLGTSPPSVLSTPTFDRFVCRLCTIHCIQYQPLPIPGPAYRQARLYCLSYGYPSDASAQTRAAKVGYTDSQAYHTTASRPRTQRHATARTQSKSLFTTHNAAPVTRYETNFRELNVALAKQEWTSVSVSRQQWRDKYIDSFTPVERGMDT